MVSILIIAEVAFYAEGLAKWLERSSDIEVVGTASVVELLASCHEHDPDVVLIDPPLSTPHPCLTPREFDVVRLIDLGMSNNEIAQELHISLSTVKNHVHNLLTKLGATRRGEAAALARTMWRGAPSTWTHES